jgi:hypothetical protein
MLAPLQNLDELLESAPMIVFPHELARFLKAHPDEQFKTCATCDCVVAEFLKHADPGAVVTVSRKRIRTTRPDAKGNRVVELHDMSEWLATFITKVDLYGLNTTDEDQLWIPLDAGQKPRTISGSHALAILATCV